MGSLPLGGVSLGVKARLRVHRLCQNLWRNDRTKGMNDPTWRPRGRDSKRGNGSISHTFRDFGWQ